MPPTRASITLPAPSVAFSAVPCGSPFSYPPPRVAQPASPSSSSPARIPSPPLASPAGGQSSAQPGSQPCRMRRPKRSRTSTPFSRRSKASRERYVLYGRRKANTASASLQEVQRLQAEIGNLRRHKTDADRAANARLQEAQREVQRLQEGISALRQEKSDADRAANACLQEAQREVQRLQEGMSALRQEKTDADRAACAAFGEPDASPNASKKR